MIPFFHWGQWNKQNKTNWFHTRKESQYIQCFNVCVMMSLVTVLILAKAIILRKWPILSTYYYLLALACVLTLTLTWLRYWLSLEMAKKLIGYGFGFGIGFDNAYGILFWLFLFFFHLFLNLLFSRWVKFVFLSDFCITVVLWHTICC